MSARWTKGSRQSHARADGKVPAVAPSSLVLGLFVVGAASFGSAVSWAATPAQAAAPGPVIAAPAADVPEFEPPPSPLLPPLLPPLTPPALAAVRPVAKPTPRVSFELGAAAAALLWQGVYGFGGLLEVGARFRLPFGSLGVSARVALEQHIQPLPAPFLFYLGGVVTYMAGKPHWRVSPYVGLVAQAMLQRLPDSVGAVPLQRDQGGLVLGGVVGGQLRLWRGGLFTELGYRGTVYSPTAAPIPAWNTVFLQLGYRISVQ